MNCKNDEEIIAKYSLMSGETSLKEVIAQGQIKAQDFFQNLYLYDSILELAVPLDIAVSIHTAIATVNNF